MKINILIIIVCMISIGCKTTQEFDNILVKKAIENAELSHESFQRSMDFTRAWLQKTDSVSGLLPSNLNNRIDLWDPANAAADNYPFMVLSAYLLDSGLLKRSPFRNSQSGKSLTSRVGVLPDVYSFSKNDFNEYPST